MTACPAGELGTGIPVFADHREMLESLNGGIDGVLITTPHFLHAPMASDVLKAGLPALVEKPLVCNLEEMRLLQSLEKPEAFVQAGQMQRFGREENWIKTWLASEAFGEPRLFNLSTRTSTPTHTAARIFGFWTRRAPVAESLSRWRSIFWIWQSRHNAPLAGTRTLRAASLQKKPHRPLRKSDKTHLNIKSNHFFL